MNNDNYQQANRPIWDDPERQSKRQPIFNVPTIILMLIASFVILHFVRTSILDNRSEIWLIIALAFIPVRYSAEWLNANFEIEHLTTPITYSFLHGDWVHLAVNSAWLLAFGTVVARRFENIRFLVFCAVCSIAGAFVHYLSNMDSQIPMIGASAMISGCMGAAMRFAFPMNGRFSINTHHLPAQSLSEAFSNPQVLLFMAIWLIINLLFGLSGEIVAGEGQSIAWQAHAGGFAAGLFLFSFFDRKNQ